MDFLEFFSNNYIKSADKYIDRVIKWSYFREERELGYLASEWTLKVEMLSFLFVHVQKVINREETFVILLAFLMDLRYLRRKALVRRNLPDILFDYGEIIVSFLVFLAVYALDHLPSFAEMIFRIHSIANPLKRWLILVTIDPVIMMSGLDKILMCMIGNTE